MMMRIILLIAVVIMLFTLSLFVANLWGVLIATQMKIRDDFNDKDYWCFTALFIIIEIFFSPMYGIFNIESLSRVLLPLLVEERVLRGEEEDMEMEVPTWFPTIPAAGCCLFLLLSGFLFWLTNTYLHKIVYMFGVHSDVSALCLKLIYPTLCCYAMAISMTLAILLAYVTTLIHRAIAASNRVLDVEMMLPAADHQQLPPPDSKVMRRFKVFETSRIRAVQFSILLCNRLVSPARA